MALQIRDLARSFVNDDLNIYVLSRDLISAEVDARTAQNLILMALTVMPAVSSSILVTVTEPAFKF